MEMTTEKWNNMWLSIVVIIIFVGALSYAVFISKEKHGLAQKFIENGFQQTGEVDGWGNKAWIKVPIQNEEKK
jgi:hypothetical protein